MSVGWRVERKVEASSGDHVNQKGYTMRRTDRRWPNLPEGARETGAVEALTSGGRCVLRRVEVFQQQRSETVRPRTDRRGLK